ncbi:hypothetical protein [Microbacterium sp. E-13]|uniref:hypothetical protein n=1 Tax=Microbacterium sp. E-13 TaxID=3404048 RepID=UPI003CEBEC53
MTDARAGDDSRPREKHRSGHVAKTAAWSVPVIAAIALRDNSVATTANPVSPLADGS